MFILNGTWQLQLRSHFRRRVSAGDSVFPSLARLHTVFATKKIYPQFGENRGKLCSTCTTNFNLILGISRTERSSKNVWAVVNAKEECHWQHVWCGRQKGCLLVSAALLYWRCKKDKNSFVFPRVLHETLTSSSLLCNFSKVSRALLIAVIVIRM